MTSSIATVKQHVKRDILRARWMSEMGYDIDTADRDKQAALCRWKFAPFLIDFFGENVGPMEEKRMAHEGKSAVQSRQPGSRASATAPTDRTTPPVNAATNRSPIRPLLRPLTKEMSLADKAYEHIKAAIIAGDIEQGRLYSVNQFASLLGVSRTPVREALLTLSQQGFLKMDRNRGFQLVEITEKDLEEVIDLRLLLEVPAMTQLASLSPRPVALFESVRAIYPELQMAAKSADLLEFLTLDRKFHLMLIGSLGNNRLTTLIGELRDSMHLPGLRKLTSIGQLEEANDDHEQLLLALESGDSRRASNVMRNHLQRTQREWH